MKVNGGAQLTGVPQQNALDCRVNPPSTTFWRDTLPVEARSDSPEGHALRSKSLHSGDDPLLADIYNQTPAAAEVPTEGSVSADSFATRPLHIHRGTGPFPDHSPFEFSEHGSHLRHGSTVRTAHVKTFCNGDQSDAFLVELGDDVGGICDGTEESIQFRHDNERPAVFRGSEEFAARWTTCEWFDATDSRILEDLGQVKSLHNAVGGNALALSFES